MLDIDLKTGQMRSTADDTVFADGPYLYSLNGRVADRDPVADELHTQTITANKNHIFLRGEFKKLNLSLEQRLRKTAEGWDETILLKNLGADPVTLSDIGMGFSTELTCRPDWRLCAIPFCVQLDGSRHDYATRDLIDGRFCNPVYHDETRCEPPLIESDRLRSEAWAWWAGQHGLLIAKYNQADIELSVAAIPRGRNRTVLRFGGVGTCLYGEPAKGHTLEPGQTFTFGTTHYIHVDGRIEDAFIRYRELLDHYGHGIPETYDPPVNWNELYDVGWHHSDPEKLRTNYTRDALLNEARKACACGCDLLYLDPGWEVTEGTTLWDRERLGTAKSFSDRLRNEFGLQLGFRTILRCYRQHWDEKYMVQHEAKPKAPIEWRDHHLWELCLCDRGFWQQKLDRILDVVQSGARFLMVDEMDWRGPCCDPEHGHIVPTTASDHVRAVYELCRELKRRCPDLTIECHDPVWPWHTCIYAPTYFQQGFGEQGAYQENWGFEYMWNCLADLQSGRALALYYYNLACNIPLYLHITMAADNDNGLFFWWAASTVRHLGIGGKDGHSSVTPANLPSYDSERRFALYRKQMTLYRQLKPYFTRGVFHGLREDVHLHTLPDRQGGVLLMFNLTDSVRGMHARVDPDMLRTGTNPRVVGAVAEKKDGLLQIQTHVPAMAAQVIRIGDAAIA